jgi:hypothetical protein
MLPRKAAYRATFVIVLQTDSGGRWFKPVGRIVRRLRATNDDSMPRGEEEEPYGLTKLDDPQLPIGGVVGLVWG